MSLPESPNRPSAPRWQVAILLLGGALLVLAAGGFAPREGPAIAVSAALYGFGAGWVMLAPRIRKPPAAQAPPPPAPRDASAALRHDLRGLLSPALMVSDRLLAHPDADVKRAGEVVARTVQRVTDRLAETKARDEADV